jgi:hypothetical protein
MMRTDAEIKRVHSIIRCVIAASLEQGKSADDPQLLPFQSNYDLLCWVLCHQDEHAFTFDKNMQKLERQLREEGYTIKEEFTH